MVEPAVMTNHRHRYFLGGVILATLGWSEPAAAQDTREAQLWTGVFLTGAVPPASPHGLAVWGDFQVRRGPTATLVLARPGLGYRFDERFTLWGGYAYIGQLPEDDVPSLHEHRTWQQLLFQQRFGPMSFQLRPRLEQRIRADEDIAWRARAFGRVNVALWHDGPLAIALWDEVFVALHDTSWGAPGGFDQNRFFLGPAYTAGNLRAEVGYLAVMVRRPDESLQVQHNLGAMTFVSF